MARVVYNENDPFAAQWLRNLSSAGHIAGGSIDARSIADVTPEDLRQSVQFHAFAGIGVWSYALRLAGWPDDEPVWTGSCPCQPFSQAGRQRGVEDERHLWPEWLRIIRELHPPVIFGEQVASPVGRAWLDVVSLDLEALGYAVGSADLCAAGVGAPHIRQRLFWVAHAAGQRSTGVDSLLRPHPERPDEGSASVFEATRGGSSSLVADTLPTGRAKRRPVSRDRQTSRSRRLGELADADVEGPQGRGVSGDSANQRAAGQGSVVGWADAEWIQCTDGKARPIEPGTFPLVDGSTQRVGRLRAYGNAIVAPLAAEFIASAMEAISG